MMTAGDETVILRSLKAEKKSLQTVHFVIVTLAVILCPMELLPAQPHCLQIMSVKQRHPSTKSFPSFQTT